MNDLDILKRASSGNIADALDRVGRAGILPQAIKPVASKASVYGRIITLGIAPAQPDDKPLPHLFSLLDGAAPGDIVVVAAQGLVEYAFFGDLLSAACVARGILAAVIDGGSRDTGSVRDMNFSLFSRGTTPTAFIGHYIFSAPNEPVEVGGVPVKMGDLFFGDEDGAVVIAAEAVDEVLATVRDVVEREEQVMARLKSGVRIADAWDDSVR